MKKYFIKEICKVVGGGTPCTSTPEYWGKDIIWVTPKDLSNNIRRYILDSEKKIVKLGYKNLLQKYFHKMQFC